jgi:hypothetical protein
MIDKILERDRVEAALSGAKCRNDYLEKLAGQESEKMILFILVGKNSDF